jgi:integrase/recombinase XerD
LKKEASMTFSLISPLSDPVDQPPTLLAQASSPLSHDTAHLRQQIAEACRSWLMRSPSPKTRSNYDRDLRQFLAFAGVSADRPEALAGVRPHQVAAWRDHLREAGLTNSSTRRKMTVLRSLYSYLQTYGFVGANPAHSDFVAAPAVPRDGKTVALSPADCRRLMDAPKISRRDEDTGKDIPLPAGLRDRALLSVLAYTGCRVGELARLKVGSYKLNGVHRVLEIMGKGGKERLVPVHLEAAERLESWLDIAGIRGEPGQPLFRPTIPAWGRERQGFASRAMTTRAVQKLVETYVRELGLDPNVTVHSLRVTALTTAREQGSDIIDLQEFAGHSDPRTTLTYIRSRDRLSKSPAYVLKY